MLQAYVTKQEQQNQLMLNHLEKYLDNPQLILDKKIKFRTSDINLNNSELQDKLVTAMIQYLIKTDENTSLRRMCRYFGTNSGFLINLIKKAYPKDSPPNYPGEIINRLRKAAGADQSYLEEVMTKYKLDIGTKDITADRRVPDTIDGNVIRASGWLSTASFKKDFLMSFRNRDNAFIEYEIVPFFELHHNYTPFVRKYEKREFHGNIAEGYQVRVKSQSIMSFYRNLGINPNPEHREVLSHNNMENTFKAGLFDMWGNVFKQDGHPILKIHVNSKFSTLLSQLQKEFGKGRKNIATGQILPSYQIYIAGGDVLVDFIREFPISNPRLLYPILYYKKCSTYPDNVSSITADKFLI